MSLWDGIKNIMNVSDDEFDDEIAENEASAPDYIENVRREQPKKETARPERKSSKTVPFTSGNMQLVLVKPERFDDVTDIADQYCAKKTVVLNLEKADRDLSRRIIDFFMGVAYAKNGTLRKAANNTFVIAPADVDVNGDVFVEDYSDSSY
ncbi:MAG: cell division protein SepF [Acutalibacteraceae bacterium]|nr:cell division protein SepF [Acutalibacteraceae bacterium]